MIDIDGTWDIETEGWDTFVCGGIWDRDGFTCHWAEDAFARALIAKEGTYWAHNGGKFDHLWLASWCARKGVSWRGIPRGSAILTMYVGEVTLRDSLGLWPDRLSVVSQLGGMPKADLALPCKCGKDCGGYCSITRKADRATKSIITSYLETDCKGLYLSLQKLADYSDRFNVSLRPTVGSSAWNTALAWCAGLEPVERDVTEYARIRDGYYGGRTQVFRARASTGHRHDIHSAYPAALAALTLPTGPALSRSPGAAFERGDAGVYTALVTVPECHVPPLPVRESDRLVYPWGHLRGTWTGDEIRHAMSQGATVTAIESGIYWKERSAILKPFADRVWALREWAKENDRSFYPWVKWLANSLTGKLAMKPEQETLYYDPDGCIPDNHHRVIGQVGDGVVYTTMRSQVSACAWVEHAAHLTAHTRIELGLQLAAAGMGAIYCDTDAVYSTDRLKRRMGDALGEWAHEGTLADWDCLAPKLYRYTNQEGKTIVKGKGMSGLTSDGFDALRDGQAWVIDRGVVGARKAIASGEPFRRKVLARRHLARTTMGDRVIVPGDTTQAPFRSHGTPAGVSRETE